jgi:hypothetical protein
MPRTSELPDNVLLIGKTKTKSGNEKNLYSVTCLFCGKSRNITRHDHATRLSKHPCKSCSNKNNNPQGEIQGVRVSWFNKFKMSATHRSLEWEITIEDVALILFEQFSRCALSGVEISAKGDLKTITASIDRIDNSIGYTKENIQLVHKKINMMRGTLTVEEFIDFCKSVSTWQESWL